MKSYIYEEFCKMTRDHITGILENQPVNDVTILMKSLQATLKFEAKLKHEIKKEFNQYVPYEVKPEEEKPHQGDDEDGPSSTNISPEKGHHQQQPEISEEE